MADLDAVREGIATQLRTIPGWQVSAQMLSNPTPPAAHVFPGEINFDMTMGRGHDDLFMTVQVFVAYVTDIGAQKNLDAYLAGAGAYSVKEAIEADRSLGGTVDDCRVVNCTGYRIYPRPEGAPVLGAEFRVHVLG